MIISFEKLFALLVLFSTGLLSSCAEIKELAMFPWQVSGADNRPQSTAIPGGLKPEQTPQFVSIGWDDNYYQPGIKWIIDYIRPLKNPIGKNNAKTFDGTPVRFSFYTNTNSREQVSPGTALANILVQAQKDGNEIGNHTKNHPDGSNFTVQQWTSEITSCTNELSALNIPRSKITGFRTPFLQFNDNTFTTLQNLNFTYDCSIDNGFDDAVDGTNFSWPYTLDKGSTDAETVAAHAGLWEMPAYAVIVPPELRAQVKKKVTAFNEATGKVDGLDWNMLAGYNENGFGMNKTEYLATLKYSLDQRLKGNRSPMLFGAHTPFYTSGAQGNDINAPNINYTQMREAVQEFIIYALSKPDVRIVPFDKILQWCRNPVALDPN